MTRFRDVRQDFLSALITWEIEKTTDNYTALLQAHADLLDAHVSATRALVPVSLVAAFGVIVAAIVVGIATWG